MTNSSSIYIDVAVALPVYSTFTYEVPEALSSQASAGKRVLVPFGKRKVTGYVLAVCDKIQPKEIKPILDVLDDEPLFPPTMIDFFRWTADYYMYPIGEVIRCALPGGLTIYDFDKFSITQTGLAALKENDATAAQKEILNVLETQPSPLKSIGRKLNKEIPGTLLQTMESCGWVLKKKELKGDRTRSKMERFVSLAASDLPAGPLSPSRRKIIEILNTVDEISVRDLKAEVPTASRLIKSLENEGFVTIKLKNTYRDPFGDSVTRDTPPLPTTDQKNVISKIVSCLGQGFRTFLLAGVTGSGKTEVYMQLAAESINRGYAVLILIPEIALISQMERRFRARFGEQVAVLHSGLSTGERYDQWLRIMRQTVPIAIGARSAIFAPFANIGLIIVDEEHDTSYKQEGGLRYNARDLAVVRAKQCSGVALLGSATPSIQSYHNVASQKFTEVNLEKRVEQRPLPEITIVDLRQSKNKRGVRRYITDELYRAMKEALGRGQQILLFLNRRGFATFPVCADCGEALKCKNCDISFTLHQQSGAYKCHYCGFSRPSASECNQCGSSRIKHLGLGTEKVEAAVKDLYPEARVARMDRDTTTRKGSIVKLLKDLRNRNIDILVGTQMVAKGHDFPNITLVGIICADLSLSFPDFRAGERTFQLLAQVSGRAGRGDLPGRVILQTYNPDHFSIAAAKDQDFKNFYKKEIVFRKALNYPPFSRMIQFKISGTDKAKTGEHARAIGDLCFKLQRSNVSFSNFVEILGPIEASLPRIAKKYRWQILLKGLRVHSLHQFVRRLLFENPAHFNNRFTKVAVDVDPFFMM
jgi:primosomal protein N' (replication factor Y)